MKRSSPAAMEDSPEFPLPPAPLPPNHRKKKTRELPNLSECHCCNRRINCTNPKKRLRILSSEWRIVLLCNSCHSLVESSRYCSYCLTSVSSSSVNSFFECKRCHRRIHKNCVAKFSVAPGNGDDFSVCFDCWVPELLVNDFNRDRNGRTRKKIKTGGDSASLGSTRVCDSQEKGKSMEVTVNEVNFLAEKKIALTIEMKEKVVTKAVVARRAVDLATGALDFVATDQGGDRGDLEVEDDAQLAIQLHRAMNSSPRIARNSCLLSTNSTNVPPLETSTNVGVGEHANSVNTDFLSCRELTGLCLAESRQDCVQRIGGTQDEKCNGDSNGCLITYSRKRQASEDGRFKEKPGKCLLKMYSRRPSCVESRNAECDHYFKTYSRRPSTTSHCKNKLQYGGFDFQHGVLTFAITLNCCEESRAFANTSS